ncbi:MAG: hypothetical protein V1773_08375 [bacterium]
MKSIFILSVLSWVLFGAFGLSNTYAQDDEYQKWLKEENKKINTFMEEQDKQFTEFLEKEWKEFQMSKGVKFDDKPKVIKPPILAEDYKIKDTPKTETKNVVPNKEEKLKQEKPVLSDSKNPFKENESKKLQDEKTLEPKKDPLFTESDPFTKKDPIIKESDPFTKTEPVIKEKEPITPPEKIHPKMEDIAKKEPVLEEKIVPKPPEKIVTTKKPVEEIKKQEPTLEITKQKPVEEIVKQENVVKTPTTESTLPAATEGSFMIGAMVPGIDVNKNESKVNVDYYGANLLFQYAKNVKVSMSGRTDNKSISKFWEDISQKNYKDLITQFDYYKKNMNLNDWGYALLINDIGERLYGKDRNSKHLFIWFILNKSGYRTKVGFVDANVVLFMPMKYKVFGISYFTSSDTKERLYVIDFDNLTAPLNGSIYSYDGDYPDAKKIMDMNIYQAPKIAESEKTRTINFRYKGIEYNVPVKYNLNTIKFYEYYPYSSLDIYFNSNVSSDTKESLLNSLKPLIEGKNEADAANILLRFVQIGFEYQTDDQQFGREKPFFPEESIFYRYNDCEDRSILYTFIVKNLLNLSVVGLDYPGHVASAVKFNVDVPGDFIMYKNQKYVVCDPTYINAYIGMSMPQYKNASLEGFIEVKN